ncbi:MFS transporter [Modestobacter sp. VKM Ac-2985]|uniref:MFS transporter n=1 Tax=Modestobacter sp. VKM Ac-2985 TaxID=3004139 RepID=UPI0022ABC230|nr:MFS transporter [Modestobacter sp. VKM Ac-2985]MCZ2836833.1 MFS transporter [Modestobacter sp. VKM Ac-2985]
MPRALLALSIGAFGIGTSEFVIMGMLPQVAEDFSVSVAAVGILISAYALGVVIGAPTLTALGVRFTPRQTLIGLMVVFTVGNTLSAVAPTYETLMAARVVTALAHGSFFGVGAVAARGLVAKEKGTQAISLMFVGLTLANVIGVPIGTFVAQQLSWRLVFGGTAAIGLLTIAGLLAWMPRVAAAPTDLRQELGAFRRRQVWLTLGVTTIGFAALFSVYSYVSPILTDLAGMPESRVTVVLALFGVGTTVGTLLGGRLGDRYGFAFVTVGLLVTAALLAVFTVVVVNQVAAVVLLVLFGAITFSGGPVVQNRAIEAARVQGGSMVSAANQGAFNAANALGAALGAATLTAGWGYRAPMWVGAVLALLGAGLSVIALRSQRAETARDAAAGATVATPMEDPVPLRAA